MFSTRNTGVGMVDAVTITGPGNVGIGTTAPATLLHTTSTSELQNTLEYTTATAGFASKVKPLRLMLTTGSGAAIGAGVGLDFITKSNNAEYPGARIVTERTDTSNNHALLFLTGGGGAAGASSQPTEKVRITSDGRVGIGNTPQAGFSLDVQGAEVLRGALSLSGSVTEFSTGRFQLNAGAGSAAHSYACIGNGNFGVGISSPGSRLVVKGAGATSATSALNVTNSADTSLLSVRDDGLTTVTGQISSTLAVGTAPLAVTSTTVCTNLNADTVDGQHASAFAAAPLFIPYDPTTTVTLTAARNALYRYTVVSPVTITLPTANQQVGDIVNILVATYASGTLTISGAVTGNDVFSATGKVTYYYVNNNVSGFGGGWYKLPVDVHTHSAADITTGTVANERLPTGNRLSGYCAGIFFG
jgi:hypothetical protein